MINIHKYYYYLMHNMEILHKFMMNKLNYIIISILLFKCFLLLLNLNLNLHSNGMIYLYTVKDNQNKYTTKIVYKIIK